MTNVNDEVEIPLEFGDLPPIEPPSRATKKQGKPTGHKRRSPSVTQLQSALEKQFFLLGTLLSGFDNYDGQVIIDKAPAMAEAFTELARTSPAVKAFLEKMIATGAWSAVITVVGGEVLLPIAVHHRLLPTAINDVISLGLDIPQTERKDIGNKINPDESPYYNGNQGQDATGTIQDDTENNGG